jgi:O-acetyl-ADP-ribose deacetylase (regulator of RNase III)
MQILQGDIFDIKEGIICHQVNCMGKMGAGIALAIRKMFPQVYSDYMAAYQLGKLQLGHVIFTPIISGKLIIASLCGQHRYGRDKQYTDYAAVEKCLARVNEYNNWHNGKLPIHIPYKMGCVNAGGNWNVMVSTINGIIPHAIVVRKD